MTNEDAFPQIAASPPPNSWDDWREYDAKAWPRKVERSYSIVPTVCFNCEAACGLLAYVDNETNEIRRLEGHPLHPASRGRNCAKGPATLSQVTNPDRILHPLRRVGPRGSGQWERVSWDTALDDVAARIRRAINEDRHDQVVYHVGRPGEDLYTERVLMAWGIDGHNSHTNVCSSAARLGYALWMGIDRPTPDHENASFILLMSAHLESGHYFQPQAQRIIGAKERGAKLAVIDTRLSNSASKADYWLAPWPGTEGALLLAIANYLIENDVCDWEFMERWVNWEQLLNDDTHLSYLHSKGLAPRVPEGRTFRDFRQLLKEMYASYTVEWAASECGVAAADIQAVAEEVAKAGHRFASYIWRNAAAGNRGGWMVARCLFLLNVLTGSVGTKGGTIPSAWAKFVPKPHTMPPPIQHWNETHYPPEYPLAHFEMSFLLPYLLRDQKKTLDVYFSRVYNPVWTNPDGFAWIQMLQEEGRIGLHMALTPVWNETAQYADYVLPMGIGPERHDLHSYETHGAQWLGYRQPVVRTARERRGEQFESTRETNPGEVWEENEFWIELSWRIDPDGSMGIREHFESPERPGAKITVHEYYKWIFENSVPGLPEAARREGLTPLEFMQRYGAFELTRDVYGQHERAVPQEILPNAVLSDGFAWSAAYPKNDNLRPHPGPFVDQYGNTRAGVQVGSEILQGFPTPSGKLEFYSTTLREWKWPEYAIPIYARDATERAAFPHISSHVHPSLIDHDSQEYLLLATFRLPTLIHTRTNGAKWLHELAHINPVWVNPVDARRMDIETGDLVRVETEIGFFVDRAWVTDAIRPGVVACSHHLGRWRLHEDHGSDRWNSSLVRLEQELGRWKMQQITGPTPFLSSDPDSARIWWSEGGVHQNLTFPVQPDPISGQHCWHQKIRVTKASEADYGTIQVDSELAEQAFRRWLSLARPASRPDGLRRPRWMLRPLKPSAQAYFQDKGGGDELATVMEPRAGDDNS